MFCAWTNKKRKKFHLPKTLADCKEIFEKDSRWRYVIVNFEKQPLCICQTHEDAVEKLNWYWKECNGFAREVVDLMYWDENYWEQFTCFTGYLEKTKQKVSGICEKHTITSGKLVFYIRTFHTKEKIKYFSMTDKLRLSNGEIVEVYKADGSNRLIEV